METINLNCWSDFASEIAKIRETYGTRTQETSDGRAITLKNDILFRGQSNSEWGLETTLERATSSNYSILQYAQRADSLVNEIESITKQSWNLETFGELRQRLTSNSDSMHAELPWYEYIVYLRHHGFPSPLLDWTRSPYVAAFFAFSEAVNDNVSRSSVFVFIERPEGTKSQRAGDAVIKHMGPYVTTDIRHFAQKASYTIATQWDRERSEHYFCRHESVTRTDLCLQDVLIKITIPRCDRIMALRQLEDYNINHYTLFQTEDSLIESLALRAFALDS